MKHIIVNNYGLFLGLKSHLLSIKKDGTTQKEIALNRIKTIQVLSKGIGLSSDLVTACSHRGIMSPQKLTNLKKFFIPKMIE